MKELFKRLKNHLWPRQYNFLSFIEIGFNFLVLVLVFYLYKKYQSVPMHRDTITIERINTCNNSKNYMSSVDISFFSPMSYVLENDSMLGSLTIKPRQRPRKIEDTIFPIVENGDYDDSLFLQYNGFFSTPPNVRVLYYASTAVEYGVKNVFLVGANKAPVVDSNYYHVQYVHKEGNYLISERYFPLNYVGEIPVITREEKSWIVSGPYSKPSRLSLYDLSQSYYHIKLNSNIDSICLSLDFVGAVAFSNMYPTPDVITMNSIRFDNLEKIKEIKEHGLTFHASFIELEKQQNVRLFCITAVMSAITTVFIGLLVLVGSKFLRKILRKKSNRKTIWTNQQPDGKR